MSPITVREWPSLTVITPSFNQAPYLGEALQSVFMQNYPRLEYFVIDGGSTDGSVEIIRNYSDRLQWWVSERDKGQTDAIRKGLEKSNGEWFNWINSDDRLAPGALEEVATLIRSGADVVAGATRNFSGDRSIGVRTARNLTVKELIAQPLGSNARFHQPSIWLRTKNILSVQFNINLHYRFDLDLYLRYLRRFPKVAYTSRVLAEFRLHPDSKTTLQPVGFREEFVAVLSQLQGDPAWADMQDLCERSKRALQWIGELEAIEKDSGRSRWTRLRAIFEGVCADPDARKIPRSWRAMRRVLIHGSR